METKQYATKQLITEKIKGEIKIKMLKYIPHFSKYVRKNRNLFHLGKVQFDSQ